MFSLKNKKTSFYFYVYFLINFINVSKSYGKKDKFNHIIIIKIDCVKINKIYIFL